MGFSHSKNQKSQDDLSSIIDIITEPKFSNIVPTIVSELTKFMGGNTPIGQVFVLVHKPHFKALDMALEAAKKNWPIQSACRDMAKLMEKMKYLNLKAVNVLGKPPASLNIGDFFKLGPEGKKIKTHLAQVDNLLDLNYKICEVLFKIDLMVKSLCIKRNVFEKAYWSSISKQHEINMGLFRISYDNSINSLIGYRNGWAKWIGVIHHSRPRVTMR